MFRCPRPRFAVTVLAAITATMLTAAPPSAAAEGDRWMPAPGQAFNDGWKPLDGLGATYRPCQEVRWHFDRGSEGPDRNTMINDIRSGLATLEPHTGLKFVEIDNADSADLNFRWGDLVAEGWGSNVAGIGGPDGYGEGSVAFSNSVDWTLNKWEGRDWRRLEWPRPDLGPGWYSWREGPGREALVVHEVMHAMGFDHVKDFTSIMYPQGAIPNNRGNLSSGDIAGLNTMYLNNPCSSEVSSDNSEESVPPAGLEISKPDRYYGTRVLRATVDDEGFMRAAIRTRLSKGQPLWVEVYTCDSADCEEYTTVSEKKIRVKKRGRAAFMVKVAEDQFVAVWDNDDELLVQWTVS